MFFVKPIATAFIIAFLIIIPFKSNAAMIWQRTGGLTDVGVRSVAVDPENSQTLYAGTDTGIYKTTNGSASWNAVNTGLPLWGDMIAVDPTNGQILYAGLGTYGVYKSANGGASWSEASNGLSDYGVSTIVIDPGNSQIVYVGMWGDGVYKTTNGGASWSAVKSGLPANANVCAMLIDPNNSQVIYVGSWEGVFKTTNGGGSWSATGLMYPTGYSLAIDRNNSQTIFAAVEGGGVGKSTNGGTSWSVLNNGLTYTDTSFLAIDPSNSQNLYVGTLSHGVFKTTNGGGSWSEFNTGLTNYSINSLVVDPSDSQIVYAGTEAGLFKAAEPVFISGTITLINGSPLAGVTMNGAACTSTDGNGFYSCTVGIGWSGTITASLSGYIFAPSSRSYSAVAANQTGHNYWATQSYTLSASIAGSGTGTINSTTPGQSFSCGYGTCFQDFPYNTSLNLTATPSSTAIFAGWSGACTNLTGDCPLTMNTNKNVTATFNIMPPIRTVGAVTNYYQSLLDAYTAAQNGTSFQIQAQAVELQDSAADLNRNVFVSLHGGFSTGFTPGNGSYTSLKGPLTVTQGSLEVDHLILSGANYCGPFMDLANWDLTQGEVDESDCLLTVGVSAAIGNTDTIISKSAFSQPVTFTWRGYFPVSTLSGHFAGFAQKPQGWSGSGHYLVNKYVFASMWDHANQLLARNDNGVSGAVYNLIQGAATVDDYFYGEYRLVWHDNLVEWYFNGTKVWEQPFDNANPVHLFFVAYDRQFRIENITVW